MVHWQFVLFCLFIVKLGPLDGALRDFDVIIQTINDIVEAFGTNNVVLASDQMEEMETILKRFRKLFSQNVRLQFDGDEVKADI